MQTGLVPKRPSAPPYAATRAKRDDVDEVQRDQPLLDRQLRPVPDSAQVVRVSERGNRHAVAQRRSMAMRVACRPIDWPYPAPPSSTRRLPRVELDLDAAIRMQPAFEQRLDVARHHADAVRIVAGQVRHDEVLGDQSGFRRLAAAGGGDRGNGLGQALLLEARTRHSA